MRLICTETLEFREFASEQHIDEKTPYGILSHCWNDEELSYQHMLRSNTDLAVKQMSGYQKVLSCCHQAAADGLAYLWADTCCIDKSSSAELQEAINSMFRWYQSAKICYAYLEDIPSSRGSELCDISPSRWFRRGWTLQELIAPRYLVFYAQDWSLIGIREYMGAQLHEITRIPLPVLEKGFVADGTYAAAETMSWAQGRETTRLEDRAYSLLGLFDVQMPMLYGEGEKAFRRLQEEILRRREDQSLFLWQGLTPRSAGLLAASPDAFLPENFYSGQTYELRVARRRGSTWSSEGVSLQVELQRIGQDIYKVRLNHYLRYTEGLIRQGIYVFRLDDEYRCHRITYNNKDIWTEVVESDEHGISVVNKFKKEHITVVDRLRTQELYELADVLGHRI